MSMVAKYTKAPAFQSVVLEKGPRNMNNSLQKLRNGGSPRRERLSLVSDMETVGITASDLSVGEELSEPLRSWGGNWRKS